MKRAVYSPSRLAMLAKCSGFLSGPAGEAALRGSGIDELVTETLNGGDPELPADVAEQVAFAVEAHHVIADEIGASIETQVSVQTSLHDVFGTLDVRAVNAFDGVAYVGDTKSGYGDRGDPAASPQLLAYAEGTLRQHPTVERFVLAFVEVDRRRVIRAELTAGEVRDGLAILAEIIKRAKADDPLDYVPGRYCGYCVRSVTCPAVASGALVPVSMAPAVPDVSAMSAEAVGAFLDRYVERVEVVEQVMSQVKARAHAIIEAGGEVPGWTLVAGRRTRRWASDADAAAALTAWAESAGIPAERLFETELISPVKAEKLDKSAKALVASLVEMKSNPKLVKDEQKKELAA